MFKKALGLSFLFVSAVAAIASLMAIDPRSLTEAIVEKKEKIRVKIPESQKVEEVEPPATTKPQESLLSTLAPDSFSAPQDLGGGVGFGSGGSGPAIGGGGGFGAEAGRLSGEKENIHRPPRLVMKSAVDYPSEARQKSVSGFVLLKILVSQTGGVETVQVEQSEPQGVFDAAAMRSVRSWKFEPAIVKGQIVAAWTMQKIKFELN